MVDFPFISRILVGFACLPVAVYVFFKNRSSCGHILLAAGLLLLGLDSLVFNFISLGIILAIQSGQIPRDHFEAGFSVTSTLSAMLTVIHWILILTGIVLICRNTTSGKARHHQPE